jgi:GntR family carbon starvation induced transcriptional regulator
MLVTLEKIEDYVSPRRQSSAAYRIIRDDIIAGAHQPGKKLKIQDLALDLKVSPSAVREALSQLVPEQLVVSKDQRGFQVAPLSIADLEDLTELRCGIEATALRRSVEQGDIDWETRVISAGHRLRALTRPASGKSPGVAEWRARHSDFHTALVSGCGSPRLMALHAQLYEQSERYRVLSAAIESDRDVDQEHQDLVTLALARDAEKLVFNMLSHIRYTTMLIVQGAKALAFD